MKKAGWILMIVVLGLSVACTKEPLPEFPERNSPFYTMTGLLNDDSLKLVVGDDEVRMNHGIDQVNGMLTYYGEMESVLENEKLRIEFIRQEKPRKGTEFNLFQSNDIPFLVHETGVAFFDFGGVGNQGDYLMLEDNNGNFVNANEIQIDEFGILQVNARIADYNNSTFNFEIKHGYKDVDLISGFSSQGNSDTISLVAKGEATYHEWFIDGVLVGGGAVYTGPITTGVHTISHRIFDEDANSSTTKGLVRFKGGKQFWEMHTAYKDGYDANIVNYGHVIVSMYKNGQWYTSSHVDANKTANFNIKDIKFLANENGPNPFMAFDLEFDSVLLSEDGLDAITLTNLSGRFLVGLQ